MYLCCFFEPIERPEVQHLVTKISRRQFDVSRRTSEKIAETTLSQSNLKRLDRLFFFPFYVQVVRTRTPASVWSQSPVPVLSRIPGVLYALTLRRTRDRRSYRRSGANGHVLQRLQ